MNEPPQQPLLPSPRQENSPPASSWWRIPLRRSCSPTPPKSGRPPSRGRPSYSTPPSPTATSTSRGEPPTSSSPSTSTSILWTLRPKEEVGVVEGRLLFAWTYYYASRPSGVGRSGWHCTPAVSRSRWEFSDSFIHYLYLSIELFFVLYSLTLFLSIHLFFVCVLYGEGR